MLNFLFPLMVIGFLTTGWFKLKDQNLFPDVCPRRFFNLDREVLHTSSMCRLRKILLSTFLFAWFVVSLDVLQNVDHLRPMFSGEKRLNKITRTPDLGMGMKISFAKFRVNPSKTAWA